MPPHCSTGQNLVARLSLEDMAPFLFRNRLILLVVSWIVGTLLAAVAAQQRPNVILILSDDQDAIYSSISYMPQVQSLIMQQGITFERFFAPVSLCCPSRVSLLRAQYAHNHKYANYL